MRTQAIEDCRYCPDPRRVAATSSALTLHVVAILFFLIPISVMQIPRPVTKPPDEPRTEVRIIEQQQPKPIETLLPPPPRPIVRPTTTIPRPDNPIVVDRPRPADTYVAPTTDLRPQDDTTQVTRVDPVPADVGLVPTYMPKPKYPLAELRRGIGGEVLVRVRVGLDGVPVLIKLERSSGYPNLDRSALDSARSWRFEPAVRNGSPVEVEATVPVKFSILSG